MKEGFLMKYISLLFSMFLLISILPAINFSGSEIESVVKPNGELDNFWWKTITFVQFCFFHLAIIAKRQLTCRNRLAWWRTAHLAMARLCRRARCYQQSQQAYTH